MINFYILFLLHLFLYIMMNDKLYLLHFKNCTHYFINELIFHKLKCFNEIERQAIKYIE